MLLCISLNLKTNLVRVLCMEKSQRDLSILPQRLSFSLQPQVLLMGPAGIWSLSLCRDHMHHQVELLAGISLLSASVQPSLKLLPVPAILVVFACIPASQNFYQWAFGSTAQGRLSGRQSGGLERAVGVGFGLTCSRHSQLKNSELPRSKLLPSQPREGWQRFELTCELCVS